MKQVLISEALLRQVLDAHRAMHEWIKAVPEPLISMPGVDGDWLDDVEGELRTALEQPAVEPVVALGAWYESLPGFKDSVFYGLKQANEFAAPQAQQESK